MITMIKDIMNVHDSAIKYIDKCNELKDLIIIGLNNKKQIIINSK